MIVNEKLFDKQLEIIKQLFRSHSNLILQLTGAVKSAADLDSKQVDSQVLLEICNKSVEDIRKISDSL